jgi:hypothetical protein
LTYQLTPAEERRVENLLDFFHSELHGEYPMRIHSRDVDDGSKWGAPAFHPQFIRWLGAEYEHVGRDQSGVYHPPDGRTRVTRVLRKIRQVAPREYYVLQLVLANGMSVNEATKRMTEREAQRNEEARSEAARKGESPPVVEDHVYDYTEVLLLLLAGLDKAYKWYQG